MKTDVSRLREIGCAEAVHVHIAFIWVNLDVTHCVAERYVVFSGNPFEFNIVTLNERDDEGGSWSGLQNGRNTDNLESVLEKNGPLISQELAGALIKAKYAENPAAARKLIERGRKSDRIESTYPVRFDNSYLYYLEKHAGREYAQAIRGLLPKKPTFQRVVKTIFANQGWITVGQIGKASGCLPAFDTSASGGRAPLNKVVDDLSQLRLIDEVAGDEGVFRIGTEFGTPKAQHASFRKKVELEFALLQSFRDWIRNCYLLAYESHTIRPDEVSATDFNQTFWDMHGPIYFGPFSRAVPLKRTQDDKSFLLAEIVGFRKFTVIDAAATIERIKSIGHRWRSIFITPVLLAPSYSKEAWNQIRGVGTIPLTFKDVFGPNIEELMRRFWRAITASEATPESLDDIESSLKMTEGESDDFATADFEMIPPNIPPWIEQRDDCVRLLVVGVASIPGQGQLPGIVGFADVLFGDDVLDVKREVRRRLLGNQAVFATVARALSDKFT